MSEITKGMEEEQEHNDITKGNKKITRKIVNAHLKKDPKYYTHLDEMEEKYTKQALKKHLGR